MQSPRRGSTAQWTELWRRWKEGQSLSDIRRALSKPPGSVFGYLSATGGIAPEPRRRSSRVLSLVEREEISRGLSSGLSLCAIAVELGRDPATVSREVARNGVVPGSASLLSIDVRSGSLRSCAWLASCDVFAARASAWPTATQIQSRSCSVPNG